MSDTHIPIALRQQVIERANNCCEYCRLSQSDNFLTFHIDHIISEKHNGLTENLCLSCPNCNIRKGSDIAGADPETQNPTFLYNPRLQIWNEHFELDAGYIDGKSAEGRLNVALLQFNKFERIAERVELERLGSYPCNL